MRKGKGKEARLVFMGHALMENRHGLLVDFQVTHATGTAERDMVPKLLDEAKERRFRPKTLGGDKNKVLTWMPNGTLLGCPLVAQFSPGCTHSAKIFPGLSGT
jgi:hypothetical protein